MNDDWTGKLSESERAEWDRFITHHHEHTVKAMESSAYVMSLVPGKDKVDVKFAVELGLAIMLDKNIVAMAQPGTPIPPRLRKVVDVVIVADLNTEAGRQQAIRQLKEYTARFEDR
jgi:hypothetical protein